MHYFTPIFLTFSMEFCGLTLTYNPDHRYHNGVYSPIIESVFSLLALLLLVFRYIFFVLLFTVDDFSWWSPFIVHASGYLAAHIICPQALALVSHWFAHFLFQVVMFIYGICVIAYSIYWLVQML